MRWGDVRISTFKESGGQVPVHPRIMGHSKDNGTKEIIAELFGS
jgi:hypothetical protein